jgi:MYXO-CTERM domain-containing protein
MNRVTKLFGSFIAMALVVPASASAFYAETRSNDDMGEPEPIRYDTSTPVEFRISMAGYPGGDGSEVEAIRAAFATWAAVDCVTISFEEGPREASPAARHWTSTSDRYILVYWLDDETFWDTPRVGHFDWAHDGTGVLIGGQVILNSYHHAWSTTGEADKMDVQGVVTALIGRVLGLTSTMEGNATYPRYVPGDITKRELGDDDIAGITYLYGDDTCAMPGTPEMLCTEIAADCPPPVMTGGDGGVGPGTRDGGGTMMGSDGGSMMMGSDGGTGGVDGGTGGDDGGCSCRVAAPARSGGGGAGLVALIIIFGALAVRRRRGR